MQKLSVLPMRVVVGACAFLMMVLVGQAGVAQQAAASTAAAKQQIAAETPAGAQAQSAAGKAAAGIAASPGAKVDVREASPAKPEKPGGEGILIHGHWVLDLKNPDGKVVDHREFDNSLVTGGGMLSGDQILAALLSGDASPGGMAVAFISGPTTTAGLDASSFCDNPTGEGQGETPPPAGIHCFGLTAPGTLNLGYAPSEIFPGQTGLTYVVSFSPSVNIQLSGSFKVPAALSALGTVNAVQTYAILCLPQASYGHGYRLTGTGNAFSQDMVASSVCVQGNTASAESYLLGALTSTNIPTGPITVVTGQIITVKVTLSFS